MNAAGSAGTEMGGGRRLAALILMAGVMLIDGFDLNAMPLAVPHLLEGYGLPMTAFGTVFAAVLVGLGLGAVALGPLGDRLGRRVMIVAPCLAIGIATLATASATTIGAFVLWRFLTGLALGACLPNVSALSAELAPEGRRSTVMAVVSAGIAIGAMAAGLLAPNIVAAAGWHGLFLLPGAIACLLAAGLWFVLPADADATAQGRGASSLGLLRPLLELVRPPYLLPFAVFAGAYAVNAVALYMITSWIPTLLPRQEGFSVDIAARISGFVQGGGLLFGIGLSWLLDRWKPGLALLCGYLIIAACFVAVRLVDPTPLNWSVLLLFAGGGISGIHTALMAFTPKLFPSRILSSAMGLGVAIARIGAIGGPYAGAALIDSGVSPGGYFAWVALPALLCAAICLAAPAAIRARERAE